MDFATMMALEPHGPDTFVGQGPRYPWGGLYGGQIVAQALWAAATTVDPGLQVHSLHAYFIRRGDHEEPIRFEVDRVRNGRSFVARRVAARQSTGAILTLGASFHVPEATDDVQAIAMPAVDLPSEPDGSAWSQQFDRRFVGGRGAEGRTRAWIRMTEPVGDDALLQACALAYVSDDLPTDGVVALLPHVVPTSDDGTWPFMSASLDHAIWFHRPIRADEWHLHDIACHGYSGARGLAIGHVFRADGVLVATLTQEVLLRPTLG